MTLSDFEKRPAELILRLRVYDTHANAILEALGKSAIDPSITDLMRREIEIARDGELEVRANHEMGILEDFFNSGDGK